MNSILGALLLVQCLVVSANSSTLSPGSTATISTSTTTTGTITTTSTGKTTTGTITTTSTGTTTTTSTPTTSTTKIVPEVKNLTVLALSTSELNVNWSSNPQNCTFSVMYNSTNKTSAIPSKLLVNLTAGHIYNVSVWAEYEGQQSAVVTQANQTYMDCKKYKWRVNTSEISVSIREPFLRVEAKHDNETYNQSGKDIHFQNLYPGCEYNISIISEFGFTLCTTTVLLDPSPVTDLKTINRTKDQITVSWTPPSDRCASSYRYRVSVPKKDNNDTVPDTSLSITGLEPGIAYDICVQSVTAGNTSSSNVCETVYTDPSNPIFTFKNVTTNSVQLHWDAPNDTNFEKYNYSVKWSSGDQTNNENITKKLFLHISSLRPGNLYNIIIQSLIADVSSEGLKLKILTEPLPPIAIAVKQNGTTTNVTWDKPTGSNISGFFLDDSIEIHKLPKAQNSCQLTNLTHGKKYNVSVWSYVTVDELLENSSVQAVKFVVDPAMIPQIICPRYSGDTNIYLSWSVPEGVWDKIELNVSSGKQYTVTDSSCTKECSQKIDGLLPATSYKFMLSTVSYDIKSAPTMIECWTSIISVATGTTVALLILILLIIIVIFILRRYQEPPKPSGFPIKHSDSMKNKPITISNFPSHFYCKHRDTDFGFSEDYQSLRSVGTNQSTNAALLPENKNKNRFTNVLPYDCSRVKLQKGQENPCSDYINANFMPGYNSSKEFIAAQGPLPNTVADFWQMIWEQNVQAVVMVTNCEEGNRVKCEQYWPKDCKPCVYEDISVTTVSDKEMEEWTLREFNVKHIKTLESRIVKHFHFTTWPDHGVPKKTQSLIAFRELVRSFMNQLTRNAPVVVHCSAGVGRTGTFIALDYLLLQLSNEMAVSVYSFVQRMRKNRPLMVQTESQYIFLHKCMLDTINAREANSELIYENSDCIYANELALKEVNNFNSIPS